MTKKMDETFLKLANHYSMRSEIYRESFENYKRDLIFYGIQDDKNLFNKLFSWKLSKEYFIKDFSILPTSVMVRSHKFSMISPLGGMTYHLKRYDDVDLSLRFGDNFSIDCSMYEENIFGGIGTWFITLNKEGVESILRDKKQTKFFNKLAEKSIAFLERKYPEELRFLFYPYHVVKEHIGKVKEE